MGVLRWSTFWPLSGAFRQKFFSGKPAPSASCKNERAVAQPKPKSSRGMGIKVQDLGELADEARGKVEHPWKPSLITRKRAQW